MRSSLHTSILSTLALAAAELCPHLSVQEIYEYLHRDIADNNAQAPSLDEVECEIAELARAGIIKKENGLYAIAEADSHQEKNKNAEKKLGQARWALAFLAAVPFVRALAVTGSVSFGRAHKTSDCDVLLIVKKGRVWTARLFSLLILELLDKRRDKKGKTDKICLNYFCAEDGIAPVQNVASANMFKRAMPVSGSTFFADFIARNVWIGDFLHHPAPQSSPSPTWESDSQVGKFAQKMGEWTLNGRAGKTLEQWTKQWQIKRLARKAPACPTPHFTLSDDAILLHHPNPRNERVMALYQTYMEK